MSDLLRFEDSGIDERILRAVTEIGFEYMTPIQSGAIPVLMEGRDVIGQAQTGTGKTAAFGIPMLQRIDPEDRSLQGMILCPTRELAMQAAEELRRFSKYMHSIRVLPVYGGQDIVRQIKALKGGVQIIVGTPGRVMDHMRRHTIKVDNLKMVVLDEADEMLDMGFREDMESILGQIEGEHQTALFSATMPEPILRITDQFQKNAELIKVVKKELTVEAIKQYLYYIRNTDKEAACARLIEYYELKRCLIFCNTKSMVDELSENLKARNITAEGLHGDMSQAQRDTVMKRFRSGSLQILIATDVAARGIDVSGVDGVINYDVPQDIEYYVHRIGRTGRAGREGMSFTLANVREYYKIREIEKICKTRLEEKKLPTIEEVHLHKQTAVLEQMKQIMDEENTADYIRAVERFEKESGLSALELAAAFLCAQTAVDEEEIIEEVRPRRREERNYGQDGTYGGRRDGRDRRYSKDGQRTGGFDGSRNERSYRREGSRSDRGYRADGTRKYDRGAYGEHGRRGNDSHRSYEDRRYTSDRHQDNGRRSGAANRGRQRGA
ncbi:MAG: DEAD/DEAH box helicase [Lachnospiraceae bacterium]|nr:DEAD/DEAH box helicase [Lachnospiraceae bacterium]